MTNQSTNETVPTAPAGSGVTVSGSPAPFPISPVPEKFDGTETVFAWLCLLGGYLFCRAFPMLDFPLGTLLLQTGLLAVLTVLLFIRKDRPQSRTAFFAFLAAFVFGAAGFFNGSAFLRFGASVLSCAAVPYFLYSYYGNGLEKGLTSHLLPEFARALLVLPFASFGKLFGALRTGKKGGRAIGKVLVGILLALLPTAIVVALLSYDAGFLGVMRKIFAFDFETVLSHLFSFLFGIPVGAYLFGSFRSSANGERRGTLTLKGCEDAANAVRILPSLTAIVSVVPLLFVYAVFFFSQWKYYVSAFSGVLPGDTVYAEYAREGFFQLCGVTFLNFLMIGLMLLLIKRDGKGTVPYSVRITALLLSVSSLILIATAASKMVLYISAYGLTRLRVWTSCFMLFLSVCTLTVMLGLFARRVRPIPVCFAAAILMFAVLVLTPVDRIIADSNVDRYLSGSLSSVDIELLVELGDDAVPAMIRLAEDYDRKNGTDLRTAARDPQVRLQLTDADQRLAVRLLAERASMEREGTFSLDLPAIRAERALREAGLLTEREEEE